jgi:PAS domain S-box-containing protein
MQNEELRRSQMELSESRDEYHALYDFAPVGYFTLDETALIKQVNLTGADLLGIHRSKLIDTKFTRFISPDFQDDFYFHCKQIFETWIKQSFDLKLLKQDGTFFYARLDSMAVQDGKGKIDQFRTAVTNITDRKLAGDALRDSKARFQDLYDNAPAAYFSISTADGLILQCNRAARRLLGYSKKALMQMKVLDLYADTPDGLPSAKKIFKRVKAGESVKNVELQMKNKDGQVFWISLSAEPVMETKENSIKSRSVVVDISDRKRAEEELQKAHDELEKRVEKRTVELATANLSLKQEIAERKQIEYALEAERQRLFSVLNELPAFIYLHEPDHSIRFANRYFRDNFGPYAQKKCYEIFKDRKEPCEDCLTFRVFETDQPQEWESSGFPDGRIYQIYDYPFTDIDGSKLVLELGIDITSRKQAESEIRRLSSRLLNAQEAERRRIAIELHDDLGLYLLVLKLQMGSLKRKMHKDQTALREECDKALLELKQTVDKVRNISHALSPSILVDLGLSAALRWLVNNFTAHYKVEASTDIPDTINVFSPEQQIVIYRIFQEILTNIGKHAHATKVYADSEKKAGTVFFRLADNGIGFDIEQTQAGSVPERGFGLAAMDERLKMLGGQFEILSRVGKGTKITFEIPIHSPV